MSVPLLPKRSQVFFSCTSNKILTLYQDRRPGLLCFPPIPPSSSHSALLLDTSWPCGHPPRSWDAPAFPSSGLSPLLFPLFRAWLLCSLLSWLPFTLRTVRKWHLLREHFPGRPLSAHPHRPSHQSLRRPILLTPSLHSPRPESTIYTFVDLFTCFLSNKNVYSMKSVNVSIISIHHFSLVSRTVITGQGEFSE